MEWLIWFIPVALVTAFSTYMAGHIIVMSIVDAVRSGGASGPPWGRWSRRRAIPRDIQDEIDQTFEWWDREFRELERSLPGYVPEAVESADEAMKKALLGIFSITENDLTQTFYVPRATDPYTPTTAELHRGEYVVPREMAVGRYRPACPSCASLRLEKVGYRLCCMDCKTWTRYPSSKDFNVPPRDRLMVLLAKYGIDANRVSDEGFNSEGYWYLTDEWEYEEDITFCNGESVMVPTSRVKEWREWPRALDFWEVNRLWRAKRGY